MPSCLPLCVHHIAYVMLYTLRYVQYVHHCMYTTSIYVHCHVYHMYTNINDGMHTIHTCTPIIILLHVHHMHQSTPLCVQCTPMVNQQTVACIQWCEYNCTPVYTVYTSLYMLANHSTSVSFQTTSRIPPSPYHLSQSLLSPPGTQAIEPDRC